MDDQTRQAITSIRDTARVHAGEDSALADELTVILDQDPPPPDGECEERLLACQDRVGELAHALAAEEAAHEVTKENLAMVQRELAECDEALRACSEMLATRTAERDDAVARLNDCQAAHEATRQRLNEVEADLQASESRNELLVAENQQLGVALDAEVEAHAETASKLDAERAAHAETMSELEAERSAHAQTNQQLVEAREMLEAEVAAHAATAAELEETQTQLDKTSAQLQQSDADLHAERAAHDVTRQALAECEGSQPPPPDGDVILETVKGLAFPRNGPDREKLFALFDVANKPPADTGFWADPSESLEVFPDGKIRMWFDVTRRTSNPNSGGSSWCNAAIPLSREVEAARLSFRVKFDPTNHGWRWGISGKFPGLMCWVGGQTPGGGHIGPGNHSSRICWNDWNRDGDSVRLGPYCYGQHIPDVPEQIWGPNYPTGTVRWGGPVIPQFDGVDSTPGRVFAIEQDVIPGSQPGWYIVRQRVDGTVVWSHELKLTEPQYGHKITHCSFALMYGGDTLEYGPGLAHPITTFDIEDFKIVELT